MKEQCKQIINKINDNRAKVYYQLNQLEQITGMSPRSLKYRMKEVKNKYTNIPSLLYKDGRAWQIHYTIINEFFPKYNKKQTSIDNHKWETIVTWNTKDGYDVNYHIQLIKEVKQILPQVNMGYVIERDGRGVNHLHALTDGSMSEVEVAVVGVLNKYIEPNQYYFDVENINNRSSSTSYLKKSGTITIL